MATMNVLGGSIVAVEKPLAPGRTAAATSRPVVKCTEDAAKEDILVAAAQSTAPVPVGLAGDWDRAAASTTKALGAAGAIGDYLSHVVIVPSSLSPGAVQIKDGSGTATDIFAGGASSLTNLVPFTVPLGMKSKVGGWSIITLTGATAYGVGDFS
jgi:hypothetical protein